MRWVRGVRISSVVQYRIKHWIRIRTLRKKLLLAGLKLYSPLLYVVSLSLCPPSTVEWTGIFVGCVISRLREWRSEMREHLLVVLDNNTWTDVRFTWMAIRIRRWIRRGGGESHLVRLTGVGPVASCVCWGSANSGDHLRARPRQIRCTKWTCWFKDYSVLLRRREILSLEVF